MKKKLYGFEVDKPSSSYSKKQAKTRPFNIFEEKAGVEDASVQTPSQEAPYNKLSIDDNDTH
jgi:hypothetical protein